MTSPSKPEFVHLHNHSEYSMLDGITRLTAPGGKGPSDLLKSLAKDGAKAVALTDHGNMYGAIEFYEQCTKLGIKPIIGCEMYLAKGSRLERTGRRKEVNCHLTVLARNFEGYQNLMTLVSLGFTEGYYYDPRIDRQLLSRHSKGLIVLSGCLNSELSKEALAGNLASAEKIAAEYRDALEPGAFFLEIMDHGIPDQRRVLECLMEINKRTGIPLVATNDCHYARKSDADAHFARICISTGKKLDEPNDLKPEGAEFYFKTPEQMAEIFSFAPDAIKNTVKIAEMCALKIPMGQMLLPQFDVPAGKTQDSYLEELCVGGLRDRFGGPFPPAHQERLGYELGVIKRLGFSGYFLVVWDFIAYARSQNIPVGPGRGSWAGSLVAFALRITNIDPLPNNLLFERFLNPDRGSMPDLDIDFADTGRERVIEYVRNKYGSGNVAQIITFGSMAARLVVRDVGRVMGFPIAEVDKLAKSIPAIPGTTLYEAMQKVPELIQAATDPRVKKLLDLSLKLEGIKRHTGVHAAGTVITKEPVLRYTPLARSGRSEVVTTQYDGDALPRLGLLKVDFLGLRTLTIIDNAVKFIRARGRPDFDVEKLPMDDPKTFELLRSGKALAVFQLDSQGIRDLMVRIKPTDFNDIVSLIALFRPGPMQAGMLDLFVNRKHGREKVKYDHALMEPILKDSYGCIVFQEQVMELSKKLANFTPGEADGLRKAMGKKIPEELEKMREQFVKGSGANKIAPKIANKVFDQMVKFGGYGFNRSHSAAYGLVAYQTAYLKANYPLEFMAAVATSEIGHSAVGSEDKENKMVTYLQEARAMGIKILPPDIQTSRAEFSISDGNAIRFGLVAVKNVGSGAVDSIVKARADGPFKDLNDFCARIDLHAANKKTLESLIHAGALDSLEAGAPIASARARLLAGLARAVDGQARIKEDLGRGQGLLFGAQDLAAHPKESDPASAPAALSEHDVLKLEKEVLGFYFSGHPLLKVKRELRLAATHDIGALNAQITTPVRLAGIMNQVKRMVTKEKGEQWARCTLEDLSGEINLLVFPRTYSNGVADELRVGRLVMASGRLSFGRSGASAEGGEGVPELVVDSIAGLETAVARFAGKLRLTCKAAALEPDILERLRLALEAHRGRVPVVLEQDCPEGLAVLEIQQRVMVSQNLLDSVEKILGEDSWRIESAS